MTKILLFVFFFIFVLNVTIQAKPIVIDENEDVMAALARLHQEVDRIRQRLNPAPDLITFASNDIADRLKRYVRTKQSDDETDTVYVNLQVDSEENLETKYVNLYVDTKRDINSKSSDSYKPSNYINTQFVYYNDNSRSNNKPYRHYHRQRQPN